jgi:hypothetical protein
VVKTVNEWGKGQGETSTKGVLSNFTAVCIFFFFFQTSRLHEPSAAGEFLGAVAIFHGNRSRDPKRYYVLEKKKFFETRQRYTGFVIFSTLKEGMYTSSPYYLSPQ